MIDPSQHFAYLADTPGTQRWVSKIFSRATASQKQGRNLVVEFGQRGALTATPPATAAAQKRWPTSFRKIVAKHARLSFPEERGWGLALGDLRLDPAMLDDTSLAGRRDVRMPLADWSDWWIFHPDKKNKH